MTRTCKNCEWCKTLFEEMTKEPMLWCRRYPRSLKVNKSYWCGEFKQKDKEE